MSTSSHLRFSPGTGSIQKNGVIKHNWEGVAKQDTKSLNWNQQKYKYITTLVSSTYKLSRSSVGSIMRTSGFTKNWMNMDSDRSTKKATWIPIDQQKDCIFAMCSARVIGNYPVRGGKDFKCAEKSFVQWGVGHRNDEWRSCMIECVSNSVRDLWSTLYQRVLSESYIFEYSNYTLNRVD